MTRSSKKTLTIKAVADISGFSNKSIEGLRKYMGDVIGNECHAVESIEFEVIDTPGETPNPSEAYRAMISSLLYNELVEEQELMIIAEPYVIDESYDLTLIPVKSEDYLDVSFALCDYKDLKLLLDYQDVQRIKAFDAESYKPGDDDDEP